MAEGYRRGWQPSLHGGRPGAERGVQPSGYQPPPAPSEAALPSPSQPNVSGALASSARGHGLPALLLERFPVSPWRGPTEEFQFFKHGQSTN